MYTIYDQEALHAVGFAEGVPFCDLEFTFLKTTRGNAARKVRREAHFPHNLLRTVTGFSLSRARASLDTDQKRLTEAIKPHEQSFVDTVRASVTAHLLGKQLRADDSGHWRASEELRGLLEQLKKSDLRRLVVAVPLDEADTPGQTLRASSKLSATAVAGEELLGANLPSSLQEVRFYAVGAGALSGVITLLKNAQLKRLNLRRMHIDGENLAKLAEAICTCVGLEELHLGENDLGDEGCKMVIRALEGLRNIRDLSLASNGMAAGSSSALLEVLAALPKMRAVSVVYNERLILDGAAVVAVIRRCIEHGSGGDASLVAGAHNAALLVGGSLIDPDIRERSRDGLAASGLAQALVALLDLAPDSAAAALGALALLPNCRDAIAAVKEPDAFESLAAALEGPEDARAPAAAALWSLAKDSSQYQKRISMSYGGRAVPCLVNLLATGGGKGAQNAAGALYHLSHDDLAREDMVRSDVVRHCLHVVRSGELDAPAEAAAVLGQLALHDVPQLVGDTGGIKALEALRDLLRSKRGGRNTPAYVAAAIRKFAKHKDNRTGIFRVRIVPDLVALLDTSAAARAASTIGYLALHASEELVPTALLAVHPLVSLLENDALPEAKAPAACALWNLALLNDDSKVLFITSGAVPRLVNIIDSKIAPADARGYAAGALGILACSETAGQEHVTAMLPEAVPALLRLAATPDAGSAGAEAITALGRLAGPSADARAEIVGQGGVDVLAKLLLPSTTDLPIENRVRAAETLRWLAWKAPYTQDAIARKPGVMRQLVYFLAVDNMELAASAAHAIHGVVVDNEENKRVAAAEGAIAPLIALMRTAVGSSPRHSTPRTAAASSGAVAALRSLAALEANQSEVAEADYDLVGIVRAGTDSAAADAAGALRHIASTASGRKREGMRLAVPVLVDALLHRGGDAPAQAARALQYLSLEQELRASMMQVVDSGDPQTGTPCVLDGLASLVRHGLGEGPARAAAVLEHLAIDEAHRDAIGEHGDAVHALVKLLVVARPARSTAVDLREDLRAAAAIWRVCVDDDRTKATVAAAPGCVARLVQLLKIEDPPNPKVAREAAGAILSLAACRIDANHRTIAREEAIPQLSRMVLEAVLAGDRPAPDASDTPLAAHDGAPSEDESPQTMAAAQAAGALRAFVLFSEPPHFQHVVKARAIRRLVLALRCRRGASLRKEAEYALLTMVTLPEAKPHIITALVSALDAKNTTLGDEAVRLLSTLGARNHGDLSRIAVAVRALLKDVHAGPAAANCERVLAALNKTRASSPKARAVRTHSTPLPAKEDAPPNAEESRASVAEYVPNVHPDVDQAAAPDPNDDDDDAHLDLTLLSSNLSKRYSNDDDL